MVQRAKKVPERLTQSPRRLFAPLQRKNVPPTGAEMPREDSVSFRGNFLSIRTMIAVIASPAQPGVAIRIPHDGVERTDSHAGASAGSE